MGVQSRLETSGRRVSNFPRVNPLNRQHAIREFELFVNGLPEEEFIPKKFKRVNIGSVLINTKTGEIIERTEPPK